VALGGGAAATVPVRDNKRPEGPVLMVPAAAWTAFLGNLTAAMQAR
jgi:hypothetical protein